MSKSFITLNRQILEWEWYHDHKMYKLFIHCLLKANWKDKKWMGITVKRSSFVTSLQKLSEQTGLTIKEVRGALSRLEVTGEITLNKPDSEKKGKPYTLVTVCKYDIYQTSSSNKGTGKAHKGQEEGTERAQKGQQLTINNNKNNENNKILLIGNEENFSKVFENAKYVEAFTVKFQMTVERLKELYLEFNDNLQLTNDTVKTNQEYISHFLNWYCKKYDVDRKTGRKRRKRIPI